MPVAVRSATPLEKSAAWLRTFVLPEPSPVTVPVSGEFPVIVTFVVEALNAVIVLFHVSRAVRVLVLVKAAPSVCEAARFQAKLFREPGVTDVMPRPTPALIVPSVAVIVGLSAL